MLSFIIPEDPNNPVEPPVQDLEDPQGPPIEEPNPNDPPVEESPPGWGAGD